MLSIAGIAEPRRNVESTSHAVLVALPRHITYPVSRRRLQHHDDVSGRSVPRVECSGGAELIGETRRSKIGGKPLFESPSVRWPRHDRVIAPSNQRHRLPVSFVGEALNAHKTMGAIHPDGVCFLWIVRATYRSHRT